MQCQCADQQEAGPPGNDPERKAGRGALGLANDPRQGTANKTQDFLMAWEFTTQVLETNWHRVPEEQMVISRHPDDEEIASRCVTAINLELGAAIEKEKIE